MTRPHQRSYALSEHVVDPHLYTPMKRQILDDILNVPPPVALYHYTTQRGLLGIIICLLLRRG